MTNEIAGPVLAEEIIAPEFFIARQPILDRNQHLYAYELLFRRAAVGPAGVVDDLAATASVIEHSSALGLQNVIGSKLGFVNVDEAVLMCDIVLFLPADKVVLEILETVKVTPKLVERVAELAGAGYVFALDDVVAESDHLTALMPFVTIIKIDLTGMQVDQLEKLSEIFLNAGKILLAEKVETLDQFNRCMDLGFTYFQGYYFARPKILSGRKLAPSQLALVQLMGLITADADNDIIETAIKEDASIGLTLLRLVNSPGAGASHTIGSLSQALIVLGRRQLQRWLQVVLYSEPGKSSHSTSPLLAMATTRGKLLELIAEKLAPGNRAIADTAFTVGIMSLMDTLFGQPMVDMVEQITMSDEVAGALLQREGFLGDLLTLAEHIERLDESCDLLMSILARLNLTSEDLNEVQLVAFEWSNQVVDPHAPRASPA